MSVTKFFNYNPKHLSYIFDTKSIFNNISNLFTNVTKNLKILLPSPTSLFITQVSHLVYPILQK